MIFIFWQGIISIHQKAFLEGLARQPGVNKVILVVEKDISEYRKNMGWNIPEFQQVELILAPTPERIRKIITEHKDAIHTMGGIRPGGMITRAFDTCVRNGCKLGIMTEPYNHFGWKGRIRTMKYNFFRFRYFRHIQFLLAIGRQGVAQFSSLGFDESRLFPWAYFLTIDPVEHPGEQKTNEKKIIYAGRLEHAKGIYRFTEALAASKNRDYIFDIYGEGPDEDKLRELIVSSGLEEKICIQPFVKHEELLKKYAGYDWVVLPSMGKDGWGAIVSEGLLNGLKAIASKICGASWVIRDGFNGVTFDWAQPAGCENALQFMLSDHKFGDRGAISKWAAESISGEAGARYFIKIMGCIYEQKPKPGIPWDTELVNQSKNSI